MSSEVPFLVYFSIMFLMFVFGSYFTSVSSGSGLEDLRLVESGLIVSLEDSVEALLYMMGGVVLELVEASPVCGRIQTSVVVPVEGLVSVLFEGASEILEGIEELPLLEVVAMVEFVLMCPIDIFSWFLVDFARSLVGSTSEVLTDPLEVLKNW